MVRRVVVPDRLDLVSADLNGVAGLMANDACLFLSSLDGLDGPLYPSPSCSFLLCLCGRRPQFRVPVLVQAEVEFMERKSIKISF